VSHPLIHRQLIAVCSLLGVSSTHLDNSSFQASHNNQQRLPIVLRLLAHSSVVVLVVSFGWWGMCNVGSDTLSSQCDPLTARPDLRGRVSGAWFAREELGAMGCWRGQGLY
jgi:hypothetical protein